MNTLFSHEELQSIELLWANSGMKGRKPNSHCKMLARLENSGINVSKFTPAGWGKPTPDWFKNIITGEGSENAHRQWAGDIRSDELGKINKSLASLKSAQVKVDKNRRLVEDYCAHHNLSNINNSKKNEFIKPYSGSVADWLISTNKVTDANKRTLVKRLHRTGMVT